MLEHITMQRTDITQVSDQKQNTQNESKDSLAISVLEQSFPPGGTMKLTLLHDK